MGTKTIGLREGAYERLKAREREDESFTDLVERLLDEATADWREGFRTLEAEEIEFSWTQSRIPASCSSWGSPARGVGRARPAERVECVLLGEATVSAGGPLETVLGLGHAEFQRTDD